MDKNLPVKNTPGNTEAFCATLEDKAPLFTAEAVIDRKIAKINLEDFRGKWILLFFYPSDFTFV